MCPSTGPLLHGVLTADSTAFRSCFKVRTKRTSEWMPVLRACSIQRCRAASLPPRRIVRKPRTSLRITAKPGHCRFKVSTICACRLVNSVRTLLNSAAATCGESCLDPVKVVASSCGALGNAEIVPSGLCFRLAPRRKEFCESRVATDVAELPNFRE